MTVLAFLPGFCVIFYFVCKLIRNMLRGRVADPITEKDLRGQCFCITGGSRGIGFQVSKILLEWGGTVVLGVRNVEEVKIKLSRVLSPSQRLRVEVYHLDLSSFESVRFFANSVFMKPKRGLNGLINNAHHSGLASMNRTVDDIEYSYQVNYLSHFLLTLLLVPSLDLSATHALPSRVINVGSRTYKYGKLRRQSFDASQRNIRTYDPDSIYADTKLLQFLFTKELAKKFYIDKLNILSDYVHPGGLVRTADGWTRGNEYSPMHRFEPTLMWLAGKPFYAKIFPLFIDD